MPKRTTRVKSHRRKIGGGKSVRVKSHTKYAKKNK